MRLLTVALNYTLFKYLATGCTRISYNLVWFNKKHFKLHAIFFKNTLD
jgi:hypothetical protein